MVACEDGKDWDGEVSDEGHSAGTSGRAEWGLDCIVRWEGLK